MAKFKLPSSFLTQLSEFSTGYVLVTIDSDGNFDVHMNADSPLKRVGMASFVGLLADHLHEAGGLAGFPNVHMEQDGEVQYTEEEPEDSGEDEA